MEGTFLFSSLTSHFKVFAVSGSKCSVRSEFATSVRWMDVPVCGLCLLPTAFPRQGWQMGEIRRQFIRMRRGEVVCQGMVVFGERILLLH